MGIGGSLETQGPYPHPKPKGQILPSGAAVALGFLTLTQHSGHWPGHSLLVGVLEEGAPDMANVPWRAQSPSAETQGSDRKASWMTTTSQVVSAPSWNDKCQGCSGA